MPSDFPNAPGHSATGGPHRPAPPGKTFELGQYYCSFCKQRVLHSVLEKVQPQEQVAEGTVVLLLECKTCGAFSLQ
jgi:ribosomal protein L44E